MGGLFVRWGRHIILGASQDFNAFQPGTQTDYTGCILLRLHQQKIQAAQHRGKKPADAVIPTMGGCGNTAIDHHQPYAPSRSQPHQVGPYFTLHKKNSDGPNAIQHLAYDGWKINGKIQEQHPGRQTFFRQGMRGGRVGCDNKKRGWPTATQFRKEPESDIHLAHADRMNPITLCGRSGQLFQDLRRIGRQPLTKSSTVSTTPPHAIKETRQHQRKPDSEQQIIEPPPHRTAPQARGCASS